MKRWLPFPLFSLALLAMWLVLNQTLALNHVLLGSVLALGGAWVLAGLQPPAGRVRRRAAVAAQLFWLVFIDIVRSNLAVARIVLQPGRLLAAHGVPTFRTHPREPAARRVPPNAGCEP